MEGEIIASVVVSGVAVIVDIRNVPYSQYTPPFNGEMVDTVLKQEYLRIM